MNWALPRGVTGFANISGGHRYELGRTLDGELPVLPVVMLNPSTATGTEDDATIRWLYSFCRRNKLGGFVVANLYSLIGSDPRVLLKAAHPVQPNAFHVCRVLEAGERLGWALVGWGSSGRKAPGFERHVQHVLKAAGNVGIELRALGVTAAGDPWHPLRKALATTPRPWVPR